MRFSPTPRVCSGLLCGLLVLLAGCGSPSSQSLDSLTVTATPSTLSVGGAAILKAVAHLSDGTTQDVTAGTKWTLSNPALATMSNNALTAKAPGALTVQAAYVEAAPAGTSPASASVTPQNLSASAQVTITAAGTSNVPTITWNAPAAISYGTALSTTQLDATANVPGTLAYTPAAGTVLGAGTQTLSATFTPTDTKTYSAATATVTLTVNQATPVITWATPAPIAPGTALSATQLDATANVPGSFMYNPAAGAVLAAGTQQLTAVFSPTDATDYASATAHTSLVVGSASQGPGSGPTPPPPTGCGGPTINLNSGMSESALQSTINSASNCGLVVFAAGTYKVSSQLTIPCVTNLTITGPPVAYGTAPTAILSSGVSNNWMMSLSACTGGLTIEYLGFNGNNPSPDGGGSIYVASPTSNLTITHNTLYGNQGNATTGNEVDTLIWLDGAAPGNTDSNITIEWNQFGSAADCSNVMNGFTYDGGYSAGGGQCAGVGVHSIVANLVIQNNNFFHQEQGVKFYEGGSQGGTNPDQFLSTATVNSNDFSNIHRISIEAQATPNPTMTFNYNSVHDQYDPGYGSWGLSLPQYDGSTPNRNTNASGNLMIANISPLCCGNAGNEYIPGAFEFWGTGQENNNVIQGNWGCGIQWGFGKSPWESSNNIIQVTGTWNGAVASAYCNEEGGKLRRPRAGILSLARYPFKLLLPRR